MKFHAACALQKVLFNQTELKGVRVIKHMIRQEQIDIIIKCYLELINEFDIQELASSFKSIMYMFNKEVKPYAIKICTLLANQYMDILTKPEIDDNYELQMTAQSSFASMRRVLEACLTDLPMLD